MGTVHAHRMDQPVTPLGAWMREHGVSINSLARAIGLSQKSTARIVHGETRSPKASTVQRIVAYTRGRVTLDHLVRPEAP